MEILEIYEHNFFTLKPYWRNLLSEIGLLHVNDKFYIDSENIINDILKTYNAKYSRLNARIYFENEQDKMVFLLKWE